MKLKALKTLLAKRERELEFYKWTTQDQRDFREMSPRRARRDTFKTVGCTFFFLYHSFSSKIYKIWRVGRKWYITTKGTGSGSYRYDNTVFEGKTKDDCLKEAKRLHQQLIDEAKAEISKSS